MKITNMQAINFINTVQTMGEKCFPLRITFAIKHNANVLRENPIKAYSEMYNELAKKYDGKEEEADRAKFMEELNVLLAEEVEVAVKKVPVSEFEKLDTDPAYSKLTFAELEVLSFMIEE